MNFASGIINGHPYTANVSLCGKIKESDGDIELLSDTSEETQKAVLAWIVENLWQVKTPYKYSSSYGLKHILEDETRIHLSKDSLNKSLIKITQHPKFDQMCIYTKIKPK